MDTNVETIKEEELSMEGTDSESVIQSSSEFHNVN